MSRKGLSKHMQVYERHMEARDKDQRIAELEAQNAKLRAERDSRQRMLLHVIAWIEDRNIYCPFLHGLWEAAKESET